MKFYYGYKHWTLEAVPRCFYVGKGLKIRSRSKGSRNHKWHTVVKRFGLRVEVCLGPVSERDALTWEEENILKEGTFSTHHDLTDIGCNFTRGGEGVLGDAWTPERRQRARLAKLGKHPSEETRLRMRLAATKRPQVTAETRVKMSNAAKLREERKRHEKS